MFKRKISTKKCNSLKKKQRKEINHLTNEKCPKSNRIAIKIWLFGSFIDFYLETPSEGNLATQNLRLRERVCIRKGYTTTIDNEYKYVQKYLFFFREKKGKGPILLNQNS